MGSVWFQVRLLNASSFWQFELVLEVPSNPFSCMRSEWKVKWNKITFQLNCVFPENSSSIFRHFSSCCMDNTLCVWPPRFVNLGFDHHQETQHEREEMRMVVITNITGRFWLNINWFTSVLYCVDNVLCSENIPLSLSLSLLFIWHGTWMETEGKCCSYCDLDELCHSLINGQFSPPPAQSHSLHRAQI